MTGQLPILKAYQVIRVAKRLGFVLHQQKGSHAVFRRETDKARVVIPVHPGKDMGLTRDEFRKLV